MICPQDLVPPFHLPLVHASMCHWIFSVSPSRWRRSEPSINSAQYSNPHSFASLLLIYRGSKEEWHIEKTRMKNKKSESTCTRTRVKIHEKKETQAKMHIIKEAVGFQRGERCASKEK
jgi:predicted alpha/beta superfamily hydrolase